MIPEEKIRDYLKRSGDEKIEDGEVEVDENGFCIWRVHEDTFILVQVYGNGSFWNKWAELKAKELNMKTILFATKRNPEPFCRKHKFKITGYVLERPV